MVDAEADAVGGKNPTVRVDADTSAARSSIAGLFAWIVALGPALIPIGAAGVAGLSGIAAAAGAGAAGLGATALGFSGISAAVKAMDKAQESSGAGAVRSAGRQASAAATIASAERSLANTRAQAADAAISAQEAVQRAEQSEQRAVTDLTRAQQTLTQARKDAARTLEDLKLQSEDAALSERQAKLDVERTKRELNYANTYYYSTTLQRQQAQLAYDEAVQHLKEQEVSNKRLASTKATADKAGVEGSKQVQTALQGEHDATQRLADARRSVADAQRAQRAQQRQSAFAIAQAEAAVANAARSQATATGGATSATNKLNEALEKLSPQARDFATFVHDTLLPDFDQLRKTAQAGLLPGVESGIKAVLPLLPQFSGFVGATAREMGTLASEAGHALTSPFWRQYFDYVGQTAIPLLDDMGHSAGNVATGFAGLLQTFQPLEQQFSSGMRHLTGEFAAFGKASGSDSSVQHFMNYVESNGPLVVHTIGDVAGAVGSLLAAAAPIGPPLLQFVDLIANLVSYQPTIAALGLEFWAWSRVLGSLGKVLPTAAGGLGLFTTKVKETEGGAKKTVTGGLTPLGLAVTAVGTAALYGYGVWKQYNDEIKTTTTNALATQHSYAQLFTTFDSLDTKVSQARHHWWNPFAQIAADLTHGKTQSQLDNFVGTVGELSSTFRVSKDTAVLLAQATGIDLTKGVGDADARVQSWITTNINADAATQRFASSTLLLSAYTNTAKDQVNAFSAALSLLSTQGQNSTLTQVGFKQAVADATTHLRAGRNALSDNTETGRTNIRMLGAAVTAAEQHANAVYQQTLMTRGRSAATTAATRTLDRDIASLIESARRAGLTKEQTDRLLRSFGLVPGTKSTKFSAPGLAAVNRDVNKLVNNLRELSQTNWLATLGIDPTQGSRGVLSSSYLHHLGPWTISYDGTPPKGRAVGGVTDAYASYLVGERGPEILTMGGASGHITPNSRIGAWTRGSDGAALGELLARNNELLERQNALTSQQNRLLDLIFRTHPAATGRAVTSALNGAASDADLYARNFPG